MPQAETACIVSKTHYDQQHFVSTPTPTTSLAPSSIRIKTILIGLSANNLSYCANGELLHWWDIYPVPSNVSPPYNNQQTYGIAVAWGYCLVTHSTIPTIKPGRILNGMFPISSHSVDLQLRQVPDLPTHYIETSPHRAKVMSVYQRYFLQPETFKLDLTDRNVALTLTLKPVWGASYVLAKYIFPQDPVIETIHPFGIPISPWTKDHGEITDTCIVCTGAGTKTSRGFIHQLVVNNHIGTPPTFSVIEVTSSSTDCSQYLPHTRIPFAHSLVRYADISASTLTSPPHNARKYILLNFAGGRDNSLERIASAISTSPAVPNAKILVVQIGSEAQVVSAGEIAGKREILKRWDAVQMNSNGVKDCAMGREGEGMFFREFEGAWRGVVGMADVRGDEDGERVSVLGMEVRVCEGDEGIKECWVRLCRGEVEGSEGLLVRLNV